LGRGSSVGVPTRYGLDGTGSNPAGGEIFRTRPDRSWDPRSFLYKEADKSLARPTSRCILFDGENISFDASLVIYTNNTNIHPIIIINRIYGTQNLLSL
jgi:hypothetical protein